MLLYTYDCDEIEIEEAAKLIWADDLLAVADERNIQFAQRDGSRIIGWDVGRFGDCWHKFSKEPVADDLQGIDCYISSPGNHPSGKEWWITPKENVFVPILEYLD